LKARLLHFVAEFGASLELGAWDLGFPRASAVGFGVSAATAAVLLSFLKQKGSGTIAPWKRVMAGE
jgi:hypothetical protein